MRNLIIIFLLLCNHFVFALMERDPTQPLIKEVVKTEAKEKKDEEYSLQSIIISPQRKIAIINDELLTVGDKIGEDIVERIEKNYIILARPGQRRTIYLFVLQNLD